MAFYKVGDQYLDEREYADHCLSNWSFWLFVIGVAVSGYAMHTILPEEWPKYLRFIGVTVPGFLGGAVLSLFAETVRRVVFWIFGFGVLAGMGALVWSVV